MRRSRFDSLPYEENLNLWLEKLTDEIESLSLILDQMIPENGSITGLDRVWRRTILARYFRSIDQLNKRSLIALRSTLQAQKHCLSMWNLESKQAWSDSGLPIVVPSHNSVPLGFERFVSSLANQSKSLGPKTVVAFNAFSDSLSGLFAETESRHT